MRLIMKKYVVSIIILFIIIVLAIVGYFIYSNNMSNKSSDVQTLNEKCLAEIDFLNTSIISMMNGINNISYANYRIVGEEINVSGSEQENSTNSENTTIDSSSVVNNDILSQNNSDVNWDNLKSELENIYDSWTTVLMDLTTLNVNKENLLKYNSTLDLIVEDLDNKDKSLSLTHMADLYNLLALYVKDFTGDSQYTSLYNVKSNVLYAYASIEIDDWDNVKKYVNIAREEFSNILNNQVNNMNNIDEINKAYILINELEEDCNNQNKKVFYVNYRNLMQELENI